MKPVVCAVTTPVQLFANSNAAYYGCDGRALLCAFALAAAVGAVGGLVTGVLSDVNVVAGRAPDPSRNLYDAFATNTSRSTWR